MTTKSAAQAALLTFGVSAMVSRFDPRVRLCAVDSDADGRFEQGFLVGARSNDDRKLKPIEPVAYTAVKGFPIEGASLTISYATPVAFNPPALQLYLVIPGVYRTTGTYSFPDNLPAPGVKETREERKAREAATPSTHHTSASVSEKSLPQTVTIGNARITIRSVNRQAKTAQISIAREQTFFPFSFKADSQTIHIYI